LASGHEHALTQLHEALPKAIRLILKKMKKKVPELNLPLLRNYFSNAYGESG